MGLQDANTKTTPAIPETLATNEDGSDMIEDWNYASVIGMLMYLDSNSRPDIQYAVHQCARFSHHPRQSHADGVKRIIRYLNATKNQGMTFKPDSGMVLDCYVDADFAGLWKSVSDQDPVCVKSRTGYVMTLGECPLIWASKLQTKIAMSTLEAEYIAISSSMIELIPLRRMLGELGTLLNLGFTETSMMHSTVFEDNNGALALAQAPKMTPRTKYIAVEYHWFREHVGEGKGIILKKVESVVQKADIFTKGLVEVIFVRIRMLLLGWRWILVITQK